MRQTGTTPGGRSWMAASVRLDPDGRHLFAEHRPQCFPQRNGVPHPLIRAVELQEAAVKAAEAAQDDDTARLLREHLEAFKRGETITEKGAVSAAKVFAHRYAFAHDITFNHGTGTRTQRTHLCRSVSH